MESALRELSRQLLGAAERSLLDTQLDALCRRVADEDVREVLTALHEAGESDTLGDVLREERLARWAEETCTTREEEAIAGQLRKWLGTGGAAGDDPARLTPIESVPEAAEALLQWAERHHMTRILMRPAHEVLASGLQLPRTSSLLDVCLESCGDDPRATSLLNAQRAADEARAYLRGQAAELAALPAREALHRRALPAGKLGLLTRRLRALASGSTLEELHTLRFVSARPVALELESGVARGALARGHAAPAQVALYLSGYEQRALEGRCDACREQPCLHQRALAARLLDACLSADDRLHAALVSYVALPSWQRFLEALSPASERKLSAGRADFLSFRVRLENERLSVAVLQRRVLPDGRVSAGKLVSPHKLARSPRASDRDRAALAALSAQTRTLTPQFIPADLTILRALIEHPELQLEGADAPLHLAEETLSVALLEQPDGLSIKVTLAGAELGNATRARELHYALCLDAPRDRLTFAPLTPALERLLGALADYRGVLPPESYPQIAPWLSGLRQVAQVSAPKVLDGLERPPPERLLLRITPLLDQGVDVGLTVRALPLAPLYSPGRGPALVHGLIDGKACSVRRELAHERALAEQLLDQLGLREQLELTPFTYRIEDTQATLELLSRAARLAGQLELEWAERARPLRISATIKSADLKVSLFKRGDWCALTGGVQQGEQRIALERLLQAAQTGERFVVVDGTDYVEIEQALFERLEQAQLVLAPLERTASLPTAGLLAWCDQLGTQTEAGDPESARWLALARAEPTSEPTELTSPLAVELRDYQREGVAWLLARSQWAPGVCLADEMGLGKTIQTIALLAERSTRGPALVIAPTSVVDGWLSELQRFAPQLTPIVHRGAAREQLLSKLVPGTVLITSYELVLRDHAAFVELQLATLVIDEAQVIKNARTLRARAVASLKAEFRVALSGTPVENRLGDLWSLFHLLAPGLLGSWARFRARFAVPIERYENQERATALRSLVRPFMLRRTKREVASELPERTDVVHLVELSTAEQDLYTAALARARSAIGKRRRNDDGARAVQILAELTRLRQLACHPRLVLEDSRVTSSKLASLMVLLEDILPRGHRVLIFSQFVRHLALVREAVEQRGLTYLSLDGSTPAGKRAELVRRFQAGEGQLFLISLKAGGTGLNLTAADYVVHMDPWWNPSVEDQASDRAHRIGQDRPVTVIKLVAQNTIEERVLGLHEHKRRLSNLVLENAAAELEPELDLAALEQLIDG